MQSSTIKVTVVGLLALGGIALAVRGIVPSRSERTDAPKPRLVAADGSTPSPQARRRAPDPAEFGWTETEGDTTYDFARVRNASDAKALAQAVADTIDTKPDANNGLGGDLAAFLSPVIGAGDSIETAINALGGTTEESTAGVDAIMSALLDMSSADVSKIEIGKITKAPDELEGMSVNASRNRDTDEDGNEVETQLTTISSSFQKFFPRALGEGAVGPLVEVKIPFRTTGASGDGPDLQMTMQLRYVASAGAWQPAAVQMASNDPKIMERVMKAARALESQQQTGG